jgi:predicted Zn-dependent protease
MIGMRTPAAAAALLLAGACATTPQEPIADLKPGERPAIGTDEAGLWMQMDAVEENLSTSGRIVTDPALNDYVRKVTCRLSVEYCKDLRLYIVQTPHFNASMAPNGTMQVWTGTLLRVQNEAQLAYVLGHEMGHYIRRHSVQRWRSIRNKTDSMAFFTVTTRMAGLGFMGDLADMAAMASVMAFSRDHERESDDIGFDLMVRAGYAAVEAPKIWVALDEERNAAGAENPSLFLSSHPPTEERLATLQARAGEHAGQGKLGNKSFVTAVRRYRTDWLRDEVRKRDFEGTQVLLANLQKAGYPAGEIHFFEGELYRLRGDDGDMKLAISAYRKAIGSKGAPAETHRALGAMYWKSGQPKQARKSFRAYLAAAPRAEDRAMIKSYIQQLK